jgi:hypothetical protein
MQTHEQWEKERQAFIAKIHREHPPVDFRIISGIARSGLRPIDAAAAINNYLCDQRQLPRSKKQITPIKKPKHPDFRTNIADFFAGIALGGGIVCFIAAWMVLQ